MKKNSLIITVCGVFGILVFSACSLNFEPAWKNKEGKASISIQFATLNPAAAVSSGRAIMSGNGYLYIRTVGGPTGDKGPYYGPYPIGEGQKFETTDIPAGTYAGIGFLHSIYNLENKAGFLALMKMSDADFSANTDGSGVATLFDTILDGDASGYYMKNVTIKEGMTNMLSLTLTPITSTATTFDVSLSSKVLPPASSMLRKFIKLTGFSVPSNSGPMDMTCTITGSGTLGTVAVYNEDGIFIKSFPPVGVLSGPKPYTVRYTGGYNYYMYIEYLGTGLTPSFTMNPAGMIGIPYYISASGGGDGLSPGAPCTFADAITAIGNNAAITVDNPANIVLTSNITDNGAVAYQLNKPVIITSGGGPFTITLGANTGTSMPFISVIASGSLFLQNATISVAPTFSAQNGLISIATSGTFTMGPGAALMNNTASSNGGGVLVNGGSFMMTGGTISGCKAGMSGGSGGGVYVASGTFVMNDGTISGNTTTGTGGAFGGGVSVVGTGIFNMSGGSIINNSTSVNNNGGGIYFGSTGALSIMGGTISGNSATNGGGVYMSSGSLTFGGNASISGNTAATSGGGMYFVTGITCAVPSGTPSITGNNITAALDQGTGVYIAGSTTPDLATATTLAPYVTGNMFSTSTASTSNIYNLP